MPTAGLLQRTGNVIWVDAVNGNDVSGTSGDPLHPFLTVGAALAVAVSVMRSRCILAPMSSLG